MVDQLIMIWCSPDTFTPNDRSRANMFTWKSWTVNQHTFDNVRQWYTSAVSILQEVRRRLSAVLSLLGRRFKHLPCMSSLLVELQELCDSLLYFWG